MGYIDSKGVYQINPEDIEVLPPEGKSSKIDSAALAKLISNPGALRGMFSLTEPQAENVAAILAGSGTALSMKLLAKHIGPELAGAVGGFLGGYVSRKVVGK